MIPSDRLWRRHFACPVETHLGPLFCVPGKSVPRNRGAAVKSDQSIFARYRQADEGGGRGPGEPPHTQIYVALVKSDCATVDNAVGVGG